MPSGIPLVVWVASLSPLLVLLAWLTAGRREPPAHWLAIGGLVSLASDALAMAIGVRGINNLWLSYLTAPLLFGSFLMALAGLQGRRIERHATRLIAALLGAASGILAVTVESFQQFSRFAVPLGALLVFSVALWNLVAAGLQGDWGLRWQRRWLWIPLGLALYSGVTAAYFPLAAVMATADRALIIAVWQLKSLLTVVAFGLLAWGIVCQSRDPSSGPSSWPSSSPSGSS